VPRSVFVGNPALRLHPRVAAASSAVVALIAFGLASAPLASATAKPVAIVDSQVVEYRLPFLAGQAFDVSQGWHSSYSHTGHSAYAYDFALPMRTPVVAAAPGVVAFAEGGHRSCGDDTLRSAANFVTIYHADGTATLYAHLSKVSVHVGQVVASGQVIGLSGKTGFTDCEPHLHFARQRQGKDVTQSIPIYFAETGHLAIRAGTVVTSHNPVCSQVSAGLPDNAFCAAYTTGGGPAPFTALRLERGVALGSPPAPGAAGIEAPASAPQTSVTWIGRFAFPSAGIYTFTLDGDPDAHLSIDGVDVTDEMDRTIPSDLGSSTDGSGGNSAFTDSEHVLFRWMAPGQHIIRADRKSTTQPYIHLDWRLTGPSTTIPTIY
jgi:murein DD-endopeptidase MepM/ murein hydrolase activator NlpD